MSVEKLMEGFEKWASVKFAGTMNFSRSGDADFYISPITRACFEAWQASRAAIEVELREAYRKGWDASGEGWNAEFPGDLHEKESWQSTRDESLGLKVKA